MPMGCLKLTYHLTCAPRLRCVYNAADDQKSHVIRLTVAAPVIWRIHSADDDAPRIYMPEQRVYIACTIEVTRKGKSVQWFLSPDPYVADGTFSQDYNRYSYARNSPLMYTDPSGEKLKWWQWALIGLGVDALTGGAVSISAAATASGAFTTASSTAIDAGFSALVTAQSVVGTLSAVDLGVIFFGSFHNGPNWGAKRIENWAKMELMPIVGIASIFDWDKSANLFERFTQSMHNGAGEYLQNLAGYGLGHYMNIAGHIDATGFHKGRMTFRLNENSIPGLGISLGHYVFGKEMALSPNDKRYDLDLFAHEFGHTYQSRTTGPLYLFKYGIASAIYQGSTEQDADWRGYRNLGIDPEGNIANYSYGPSRYKWFEFLGAPVLWPFMWMWHK